MTGILREINDVLDKKYIVDILSDGTEELNEMLKAMWNGIHVIMSSPVLAANDTYYVNEKCYNRKEDLVIALTEIMSERFAGIRNKVNDTGFLSDKTEDQLFEFYDKILDLDRNDCLHLKKGKHLKTGESERKLNALVGLDSVKESIRKLKAYAVVNLSLIHI